jgi:basic amino acid/polyamine antiporter, APA family
MSDRPPLGPITLLALGVNGIVGVGIFVAPPTVATAFPGALGALLYPAIAIACLPVALVYARLSRAYPTDGGPALYAARAFGPATASAIGAVVWVSAVFSSAAVTRALADRFGHVWIAALLAVVLALVNLRGLRLSAWAWTALTIAKLTPLLLLAFLGFRGQPATASGPSVARGAAMLAVLFALQGFEIVPLPAGQARDPEKNVPRATIGALLAAGLLYAFVHLACARALPNLATSSAPIPQAAAVLGGPRLARGIDLGVTASIAGIVIGMHAMTPRYLAALTREREAEVPRTSILVTALAIATLCMFSSLPQLLSLSSIAVLAQFATTAIALITLARRREAGLTFRDLWPAPLALVVVMVLVVQAQPREILLAAGVGVGGAVLARLLGRPR